MKTLFTHLLCRPALATATAFLPAAGADHAQSGESQRPVNPGPTCPRTERRAQPRPWSLGCSVRLGLLSAVISWVGQPALHAQTAATLTTLHSFSGSSDGATVVPALVQGSDGNFYGTTRYGGANDDGTVFRITPAGTLTSLYSFTGGSDGANPYGSLVQGSDGNFYGTAPVGGTGGDGTVFRITPGGALTTLYTFSGSDGANPYTALIKGRDGSFYGTTDAGGANNGGTVFQITPAGTLTSLYSFTRGSDGYDPATALVQGSDGNFYGTAIYGGASDDGTVFQITPAGALTTLYTFSGSDGAIPQPGLVQGSDGSFYGATYEGGVNGGGTVFKITPTGALTTLHNFSLQTDGAVPYAALIQGSDGSFYGTASTGGANEDGTVFKITPTGVFTTLYSFSGSDGQNPLGSLVQGSDGSFYGTDSTGGANDAGTVFKLTVAGVASPHPAFFSGETALGDGVYYLSFPSGNYFGYYSYLTNPNYIYHFDLGYEYVFDAADGKDGVYFYDFASSDFFYTSPSFPFPYLYDFSLDTVLYYYPDPNNAGHYNTDGIRYFYDFNTGAIITK